MKLYNSLTRNLESFQPDGDVKFYTCGITPYDTTHLGHAFTYFVSDVLIRFLEFKGHKVTYVQNVTDIDDDILIKARKEGEDWWSLGNRWTRHFIEDIKKLNVRPPAHFPRATDFIPSIIEFVEKLLLNDVAYEEKGNIYYSVESWPEYGKLSRIPSEDMLTIANQRGNHPNDPNKRSALDFPLWQAQIGDEPAWNSPWGPGRPGWHIECSTMATELLGNEIDIHSGGEDLIFPHHESEIAQTEPLTDDEPFVKIWLHVAMVRHCGEKISKSLGNLVLINDLLKTWPADAIRIYLAMHHYRSSWSHQKTELEQAMNIYTNIRNAVSMKSGKKAKLDPASFQHSFILALESDLDTLSAVEVVAKWANEIVAAAQSGIDILDAQRALQECSHILGLRIDPDKPDPDVIKGWNTHLSKFK